MNKTLLAVVVIVILIAGAYAVFRNKSGTNSTTNTAATATPTATDATATTSPTAASQNTAVITNFAFSPAKLSVKVGTTVTWTNNDAVAHSVTSDSGPASFDSGTIGQNQTFSNKFTVAGTYTYHCRFHPYMTGTVEVAD